VSRYLRTDKWKVVRLLRFVGVKTLLVIFTLVAIALFYLSYALYEHFRYSVDFSVVVLIIIGSFFALTVILTARDAYRDRQPSE
jgi:uncharacterized membrane protein YqjE